MTTTNTTLRILQNAFLALLVVCAALLQTHAQAASPSPSGKPTIVLVHGAFAESLSWESVIERLLAKGYPVVAVANPLRGLRSDSAYVSNLVDTIPGPVVMVGHSYGGAVISNAAEGIARAWAVLMKRLGYSRYVAQGGDWGNAVTEQMALLAPPGLVGIHTNMPATIPDDIAKALQASGAPPAGLSGEEKYAYDQLDFFYKNGLSYAQEMSKRPQTLYGIEDSPIGLAAWMLDHDARSYALISRLFAGKSEGLTRNDILDNITLYWLTNTGVSSARLYWESKLAFFAPKGVALPVAVSAFPDEIYTAPRSWTERAYPKLVHYGRLDKGGHFAAWEQPEVFATELRAGFKSLRG